MQISEAKLQRGLSWDLLKMLSLWRQKFPLEISPGDQPGDVQVLVYSQCPFSRERKEEEWAMLKVMLESNKTLFILCWKGPLGRSAGPGKKHSPSSIKRCTKCPAKVCGRCTKACVSKGSTKRLRISSNSKHQLYVSFAAHVSSTYPLKRDTDLYSSSWREGHRGKKTKQTWKNLAGVVDLSLQRKYLLLSVLPSIQASRLCQVFRREVSARRWEERALGTYSHART